MKLEALLYRAYERAYRFQIALKATRREICAARLEVRRLENATGDLERLIIKGCDIELLQGELEKLKSQLYVRPELIALIEKLIAEWERAHP